MAHSTAHLEHAIKTGNLRVAMAAQSSGESLSTVDRHRRGPAHWASAAGHVEVLKWLAKQGAADAGAKDLGGATPVLLAAFHGHLPALQWWAANGENVAAPPTDELQVPVIAAAMASGNLDMVRWLIGEGASLEARVWGFGSLAGPAAMSGSVDLLARLQAKGVDILNEGPEEDTGLPTLHVAAAWGHVHVMQWLVDAGARVDKQSNRGYTAWSMDPMRAVLRGPPLPGTPVHIFDQPALPPEKVIAVLEWLHTAGDEANLQTKEGATHFHYAAATCRAPVLQWLAEHGAGDVHALLPKSAPHRPNNRDRTPLHVAAESGNGSALRWLVEAGAEVDTEDGNNATPLMLCVGCGPHPPADLRAPHRVDMAKYLIGMGADVTAGASGELVGAAVRAGALELTAMLLDTGGSLGSPEAARDTLQAVSIKGNTPMLHFLASLPQPQGPPCMAFGGVSIAAVLGANHTPTSLARTLQCLHIMLAYKDEATVVEASRLRLPRPALGEPALNVLGRWLADGEDAAQDPAPETLGQAGARFFATLWAAAPNALIAHSDDSACLAVVTAIVRKHGAAAGAGIPGVARGIAGRANWTARHLVVLHRERHGPQLPAPILRAFSTGALEALPTRAHGSGRVAARAQRLLAASKAKTSAASRGTASSARLPSTRVARSVRRAGAGVVRGGGGVASARAAMPRAKPQPIVSRATPSSRPGLLSSKAQGRRGGRRNSLAMAAAKVFAAGARRPRRPTLTASTSKARSALQRAAAAVLASGASAASTAGGVLSPSPPGGGRRVSLINFG